MDLLWLSADTRTYEASSCSQSFGTVWCTSVRFGNVRKAFLPCLRGKRIAIILRFFGERDSKVVQKIQKNCQICFTIVLTLIRTYVDICQQ